MSWQDDLRQLDQALADGRISADSYREGRDRILAAYATGASTSAPAGGAPPGTPPGGTPAQPEPQQQAQQPQPQQSEAQQPQAQQAQPQQGQPQQGQPNSGPFAPPFRWTSTSPAEATQVVSNRPPGNAETTQVVPGGRADNPEATQVVNRDVGMSERTQAFHPVGTPGPEQAGQQQWPRPQQWTASDSAPPWGPDSGLVAPNPGWLTQGPEVFERAGTSNRTRLVVILVAVVVLAGLGVGAFFLFGHNNNHNAPNPAPATRTAAPTTTAPPRDDLSIATLPGHIEDHSNVTAFTSVPGAGFLTQEELSFYQTAGAGRARLSTSVTDGTVHVLIFTTQVSSDAAAATCRDSLAQKQIAYGMTQYPNPPTGVQVAQADRGNGNPALIRAHYVHNRTVIRIQVNGPNIGSVTAVFRTVVAAQLKVLSANG